jgi:hypothetical protein
MGRPVIIDPGGDPPGGGGGGVSVLQPGQVEIGGLRQLVLKGMALTAYGEVGRLDVQAMPQAVPLLAPGAAVIWSLMPAALTEFGGLAIHRQRADLTGAGQARLVANVSTGGAATPAKLRVQYSTDLAAWAYLDDASGPSVGINATGLIVSAWVTLAAAAAADVYLRLVGIDGDGIASPAFGAIVSQVR